MADGSLISGSSSLEEAEVEQRTFKCTVEKKAPCADDKVAHQRDQEYGIMAILQTAFHALHCKI